VGRIQSTKSGVLNTVSPSQLLPPGTASCQKANAIGRKPAGKRPCNATRSPMAFSGHGFHSALCLCRTSAPRSRHQNTRGAHGRCQSAAAALVRSCRTAGRTHNMTADYHSLHALSRRNGSKNFNAISRHHRSHHRVVVIDGKRRSHAQVSLPLPRQNAQNPPGTTPYAFPHLPIHILLTHPPQ
jgi:hypothetical protein